MAEDEEEKQLIGTEQTEKVFIEQEERTKKQKESEETKRQK